MKNNNLQNIATLVPRLASELKIIWIVALTVFGFQTFAQTPPVISMRFNNPSYDCNTQTYCVDVEFNSNKAGLRLYYMNVRFFYETSVLQYQSIGSFAKWYISKGNPMPYITTEVGTDLGINGNINYWNGAVFLYNTYGSDGNGGDIVPISNVPGVWTKLFSFCFKVINPAAFTEAGICPALIWDLEQDPLKGGFGDQSDGVVITYLNPGTTYGYLSATENVNQFNWMYNPDPLERPYGNKTSAMCITGYEGPPVLPVPDGNSTVTCLSEAVPPVIPYATENCGGSATITGVLESIADHPDPLVCEGTRIYTYRYTDSSGNSAWWRFTYTIEYEGFLAPPDEEKSITCVSQATEPVPPVITDHCGNLLTPEGPARGGTYNGCTGTLTWQWTYRDCEGNTDVWTYTCRIDHTSPPVLTGTPVPFESTVKNISEAVPTVSLPEVRDACGTVLSPTADSPVKVQNLTGCGGTIAYTWHFRDCAGLVFSWTYTYWLVCTGLEAKVMLEGAMMNLVNTSVYHTDTMRTTLNYKRMLPGQTYRDLSGKLVYTPSGQPFSVNPWSYEGTEGSVYDSGGKAESSAGYPATVVDWILVSLRTAADGASFCRKAALLHKDGKIDLPLGFSDCDVSLSGNYYLVVEHRNHLLVMSDKPLPLVNGTITYDFTVQQSYLDPVVQRYVGQKLIGGKKYAMYTGNGMQVPGNTSADTDINSDDRKYWSERTGILGYLHSDYNLNGDTNADDQTLWERCNGLTTGVPRF